MHMKKTLSAIVLATLVLIPMMAAAEQEQSNARAAIEKLSGHCPVAETVDAEGQPVLLWQHVFDDGARDLAMARIQQGKLGDIHRVTFGGGTEPGCRYRGVAITRGGDWGWHLAWTLAQVEQGKPALRYARMDGAAWVSSPAKRFGADGAHSPSLQVDGERVMLIWRETLDGEEVERSVSSADGGRSWD